PRARASPHRSGPPHPLHSFPTRRSSDLTGLAGSQALALKHLAASQGLTLTERQASDLVRTRRDLREDALLWTYVWEPDRRARNRSDEHTSGLPSLTHLGCPPLLAKKTRH